MEDDFYDQVKSIDLNARSTAQLIQQILDNRMSFPRFAQPLLTRKGGKTDFQSEFQKLINPHVKSQLSSAWYRGQQQKDINYPGEVQLVERLYSSRQYQSIDESVTQQRGAVWEQTIFQGADLQRGQVLNGADYEASRVQYKLLVEGLITNYFRQLQTILQDPRQDDVYKIYTRPMQARVKTQAEYYIKRGLPRPGDRNNPNRIYFQGNDANNTHKLLLFGFDVKYGVNDLSDQYQIDDINSNVLAGPIAALYDTLAKGAQLSDIVEHMAKAVQQTQRFNRRQISTHYMQLAEILTKDNNVADYYVDGVNTDDVTALFIESNTNTNNFSAQINSILKALKFINILKQQIGPIQTNEQINPTDYMGLTQLRLRSGGLSITDFSNDFQETFQQLDFETLMGADIKNGYSMTYLALIIECIQDVIQYIILHRRSIAIELIYTFMNIPVISTGVEQATIHFSMNNWLQSICTIKILQLIIDDKQQGKIPREGLDYQSIFYKSDDYPVSRIYSLDPIQARYSEQIKTQFREALSGQHTKPTYYQLSKPELTLATKNIISYAQKATQQYGDSLGVQYNPDNTDFVMGEGLFTIDQTFAGVMSITYRSQIESHIQKDMSFNEQFRLSQELLNMSKEQRQQRLKSHIYTYMSYMGDITKYNSVFKQCFLNIAARLQQGLEQLFLSRHRRQVRIPTLFYQVVVNTPLYNIEERTYHKSYKTVSFQIQQMDIKQLNTPGLMYQRFIRNFLNEYLRIEDQYVGEEKDNIINEIPEKSRRNGYMVMYLMMQIVQIRVTALDFKTGQVVIDEPEQIQEQQPIIVIDQPPVNRKKKRNIEEQQDEESKATELTPYMKSELKVAQAYKYNKQMLQSTYDKILTSKSIQQLGGLLQIKQGRLVDIMSAGFSKGEKNPNLSTQEVVFVAVYNHMKLNPDQIPKRFSKSIGSSNNEGTVIDTRNFNEFSQRQITIVRDLIQTQFDFKTAVQRYFIQTNVENSLQLDEFAEYKEQQQIKRMGCLLQCEAYIHYKYQTITEPQRVSYAIQGDLWRWLNSMNGLQISFRVWSPQDPDIMFSKYYDPCLQIQIIIVVSDYHVFIGDQQKVANFRRYNYIRDGSKYLLSSFPKYFRYTNVSKKTYNDVFTYPQTVYNIKPCQGLLVFDFETTSQSGQNLQPFCVCLYGRVKDRIIQETFVGIDCDYKLIYFLLKLAESVEQQSVIELVGFNNAKFDNYLLLKALYGVIGPSNIQISGGLTNSKMITFDIYQVKDIYLTVQCSLKQACISYGLAKSLSKSDFDILQYPTWVDLLNNQQQVTDYCMQDCIATYTLVNKVSESFETLKDRVLSDLFQTNQNASFMCSRCPTSVSSVANKFLAFILKKISSKFTIQGISDESIQEVCRKSYRGGICIALNYAVQKDVIVLDFSSLYPYIMQQQKPGLPYQFIKQICILNNKDNYPITPTNLYRVVDFKYKKNAIPRITQRIGGINVLLKEYSHDFDDDYLYVWGVEINRDDFEYIDVDFEYVFKVQSGDNDFSRIINFLYEEKQKAQQRGDAVQRQVTKLILNSLYGFFGKKDYQTEQYYTAQGWDIFTQNQVYKQSKKQLAEDYVDKNIQVIQSQIDSIGVVSIHNQKYLKVVKKPFFDKMQSGSCVYLASYITACARARLFNALQITGVDNCYYMDTDSLFVSKQGFKLLKEAGYVKSEFGFLVNDISSKPDDVAKCDYFQAFAAKVYVAQDAQKRIIKAAFKGVQKDHETKKVCDQNPDVVVTSKKFSMKYFDILRQQTDSEIKLDVAKKDTLVKKDGHIRRQIMDLKMSFKPTVFVDEYGRGSFFQDKQTYLKYYDMYLTYEFNDYITSNFIYK